MSKKIKITGIELETKDGKPVGLTLDEAKDLYEQLKGLFGEKTKYIPGNPIIIERDYWRPYKYTPTPILCDSSGSDKFSITGDSGLKATFSCEAVREAAMV